MNPDEIRTAQIQRQHSQEMALRFFSAIVSKMPAKDVPDFGTAWPIVVGLTDDFERDIANAVAFREGRPSVGQKSNGDNPVASEVVIDVDRVDKIVTMIKQTDKTLHPMIKNKMTSMGIKGISNLENAVKQLTPAKADDLQDYVASIELPG